MRRWSMLALILFFAVGTVPAQAPEFGSPQPLPGLKAAAKITRDVYGIAHVRANHDQDLFFLQGWVHAEDRLFQMDVSRRRASGTLAELLGPAALPGDVELRTLGLRRGAEASLGVLSDEAHAALGAYAAGVNAWVESHPLPPEYGALELTGFEPWTEVDSVAVAKLIAFGLSFGLEDIGYTQALDAYVNAQGMPDGYDPLALFFFDLFRTAPFTRASSVPDALGVAPATTAGGSAVLDGRPVADVPTFPSGVPDLARDYRDRLQGDDFLRTFLDRDRPRGSNQWAVAGTHTASGRPLVANDPHLALDVPTTFYPMHLTAPGWNVYGNCFAGIPGVVIGQNENIAWGATVNPLDVTDVYFEQVTPDPTSPSGLSTVFQGALEPVIPIPERFFANQPGNGVPDDVVPIPPEAGVPPATLIVPRRNFGPIVALDGATGQALSVQYTGFGPTRELDTFLIWDRARGLDDFRRGLQFFDFGSQNWIYGDVHGNIAYFTSAEMPVRADLQAGAVAGLPPYFIRDGISGANEWLEVQNPQPGQSIPYEILPQDEMPHVVNPPAGWVVNANNDPIGNTLDNDPLNEVRPGGGIYYLSPGYDGFRAGQITQHLRRKLAAGEKLDLEDMKELQGDVAWIDAQALTPYILNAWQRANADGADPALAAFLDDEAVAEAVGRLAGWSFVGVTGIPEGFDYSDVNGVRAAPDEDEIQASVAATIYAVWRGQILRNTIDATLARYGLPGPGSSLAMSALRNMLDLYPVLRGYGASGLNFFHVDGVDDPDDRRDILILQSLADALERLAGLPFEPAFGGSLDQDDYRWGKLHRITFDHPLGPPFSIPPAGGGFPDPLPGLPGIPTDGGFGVPDASSHNSRADDVNDFRFGSGPANRFVAECFRGGVYAESTWPGGTSGVLGDPSFANLLPLWLTNDTLPLFFEQHDVRRNAASVERFVPRKGGGPSGGGSPGERGRHGKGLRGRELP